MTCLELGFLLRSSGILSCRGLECCLDMAFYNVWPGSCFMSSGRQGMSGYLVVALRYCLITGFSYGMDALIQYKRLPMKNNLLKRLNRESDESF